MAYPSGSTASSTSSSTRAAPAVAPLATAAERSLRSGFGAERFLLVVARWPD